MNHFFNQIRRKMPEIGFFLFFHNWLLLIADCMWFQVTETMHPMTQKLDLDFWIWIGFGFFLFLHNWPLLIADCMWFQVTKTMHPMAQKLTRMTQKVDLNQDLWWFVTPIPMALAVALRLVYASNAGTTYWIPKKQ